MEVRSLHVLTHHEKVKIADFSLSDASLSYISHTNNLTFTLHASLGKASVLDMSKQAGLYSNALTIVGENSLLDFTLLKLPPPQHPLEADYSASLTMASVRMVFLQRFVDELLWYLDNLSFTTETGHVDAGASKSKTKLLYQATISNPVIVLPLNAQSAQTMEADLGRLKISNSFEVGEEQAILEHIQIEAERMTGVVGSLVGKGKPQKIVEEITFSLTVSREVEPGTQHEGSPLTSIRLNISEVVVFLSKQELEFFLKIPKENLEQPSAFLQAVAPTPARSNSSIGGREDTQILGSSLSLVPAEMTSHLVITLENSSLGLQSDTHFTFAEFKLSTARFGYSKFRDGAWAVEFASNSMIAHGIDPQTHQRSILLGPSKAIPNPTILVDIAERPPFFAFNAKWSASGSSKVNLNLYEPRGYLLFNTIFKVMDFFDLAAQGEGSKSPDPGAPQVRRNSSSLSLSRSPQLSHPTSVISFSVSNPEFTLIEDPGDENSPAIVLGFYLAANFSEHEGEEKCSISFQQLQVFSCQLGLPESNMSIIDPFSVTIEYTKELLEEVTILTIEVNVEEILARFAYEDFRILSGVFDSLPSRPSKPVENSPLMTPVEKDSLSSSAISVPGSSSSVQQPSAQPIQQRLQITMKQGYLVLVDDSTGNYIPLFEIQASDVDIEFRDWTATLKMRSASTLSSNFFNRKQAAWEPFLEPWPVFAPHSFSFPVARWFVCLR